MSKVFTATSGQQFRITGINDQLALDDALAHTAEGRPFGRWNMQRLAHFYGVKVEFVPRKQKEIPDDGY